jgi:FtsP/CotA-like multicopper oxidase with cupredoxin domain
MTSRVKKTIGLGAGLAALASLLVLATGQAGAGSGSQLAPAAAIQTAIAPASVSFDLCAKEGLLALPGGTSVPIWGYAEKPDGIACSDPSVEAALPGPALEVTTGAAVTINLYNDLDENTSILLPGATAEAAEALPPSGGVSGTASYEFTAGDPGTYLYQSGSDVSRQVPMGLYGALVVRSGTNGQAYNTDESAYDTEALLVLSEIDPDLNADPTGFNLLHWSPSYWLINGKAYPDTDEIAAASGNRVLLRYINAGLDHHTMTLLGKHQRVIAKDASPVRYPFDVVAETIASGQTMDTIVSIPAGTPDGTKFALYNRQLRITNVNDFPGGMLTFIDPDAAAAPQAVGITPRLLSVRAAVRGHRVRFIARIASCAECGARVQLRMHGVWRGLGLHTAANGALVGTLRNVASGRRPYRLSVRDAGTGIALTFPKRFVRVP